MSKIILDAIKIVYLSLLDMKVRYLKLKNWLLLSLMGLLGLSACSTTKEVSNTVSAPEPEGQPTPRPEVALMYGVPTMEFQVRGAVTDEQGNPIKGMQVILVNQNLDVDANNIPEDNKYVMDYIAGCSDTTDAEGRFTVVTRDTPRDSQRIIVRDIDGASNGVYENKMEEVQFEEVKGQRNGWFVGTATQEQNLVVKKVEKK